MKNSQPSVIQRAACLLVMLSVPFLTWGSRAYHRPRLVMQPDGTMLTVVKQGTASYSYSATADGVPLLLINNKWYMARPTLNGSLESTGMAAKEAFRRSAGEQQMALALKALMQERLSMSVGQQRYGVGSKADASVKGRGEERIPILLVAFSDIDFAKENDKSFYMHYFNEEGFHEQGFQGSVRDYFVVQSDGQFLPKYDVLGMVQLNRPRAYYGENVRGSDVRDRQMMVEALQAAIDSGIDFSSYEDETGNIPFVGMVYAGVGEQASSVEDAVWAKYHGTLYARCGNRLFVSALCTSELAEYDTDQPQTDGIGTFCHEFSHAMGLPDMYNTNGLSDIFGLDYWDIMDFGQYWADGKLPVGYSAYERAFMGWMEIPVLATEKQYVEITPLHTQEKGRAVKIVNPSSAQEKEYFILENRQPSAWFPERFGSGLMVYHIDYEPLLWQRNTLNNDGQHPCISIVPADGILTSAFEATDFDSYRGDFFPGLEEVADIDLGSAPPYGVFYPPMEGYRLSQIRTEKNGNVSFSFMAQGRLSVPENLTYSLLGDSAIQVRWNVVPDAEAYVVSLTEEWMKSDTVKKEHYEFTRPSNQEFTLCLTAIAEDFVDSPPVTLQIKMGNVGIQATKAPQKRQTKAYSLQGYRVVDARKGTENRGLYIIPESKLKKN
ncbi:MAG: M6 family metalloprotease domain-containing protein [Bacteroidaceae bacterium]|nr:M6 family metalloprotease domain-containing protein [Bacteroidaceae bacterium]